MLVLENHWKEEFVQTNDINLHYVTAGSGKLMLMLHGFPEFWYSWRYQIKEFSENYKVVALDLRGYNKSDRPSNKSAYKMDEFIKDVEGAIKGLGYEDCILVAHDWGAAIAWSFAYAHPEMVEKLIIMNVPHPVKFQQGLKTFQQLRKSWYIFFFQLPLLPELWLKSNNYQIIGRLFSEMAIDKSAFSVVDIQAYKDAAAEPGALTAMVNYYRNIFQKLLNKTNKRVTSKLEIPTLMIWGEEDTALGKELTYGTDEYVKDLELKYIPNCSHWVQQEKPQLVNQYMREFLG